MKSYVASIGGIAITVLVGYGAWSFATKKEGVILHTQGETISCERVDTYEEALSYAHIIGKTGIERFGPSYGCSYAEIYIGPWVFKAQEDLAITAHAPNYNTKAIGLMWCRTDDEEWNKITMYTGRSRFIQLNDEHKFKFSLFHSDVATNGKTDPHEFKPWMIKLGMRFDGRDEGVRKNVPSRQSDLSWRKI